MSLGDKKLFKIGIFFIALALCFVFLEWYLGATNSAPKSGGLLREAYVGQPVNLNPILLQSEADQEISGLVFNGLLKANGQGGTEYDLADNIEKSEDGKIWKVKLREGIFWHDGEEFNADDVLFTIKTIQNPDSRSPFRQSWQGVEVIKDSKFNLTFELKDSFVFFEENLKQKISPQHIFGDIPVANLYLSEYNFEPIGTGPYVFDILHRTKEGFITDYSFQANKNYFLGTPLIDKIIFKFYKSEPEAIKSFNNRQVDLLSGIFFSDFKDIKRSFLELKILLPRYFAVFFNANINKIFSDWSVRDALNLSIDRQELADKIFGDRVQLVNGPLLPGMIGYDVKSEIDFSLEEASEILAKNGWDDGNGDGVLEKKFNKDDKENIDLSFQIVVPESGPLVETASILKKQWAKIGARLEIKIASQDDLQGKYFESRIYDSVLFGNIINHQPDLFSFWHSSQRFHPGFNLSLYENAKVDSLLEKERREMDEGNRMEMLSQIQKIILEDAPAVFLFNPYYNIISIANLNFGEPSYSNDWSFKFNSQSEKYFNVHKWYLKTDRVFSK